MTTYYLWPFPGASVPVPDAEGAILSASGGSLTRNDYLDDLIRDGLLLTSDPATSGGGGTPDLTPLTGVVDYVTTELVLVVSLASAITETVYRNGAFLPPYNTLSTLSLTTGAYSVVRTGGWPLSSKTLYVRSTRQGQDPFRAFSWDPLKGTSRATVTMVTISQNTYRDPVVKAAEANALVGPLVLKQAAPPGLYSSSDTPTASAAAISAGFSDTSAWDNVHYTVGRVNAAAQWSAWLAAYVAAGGREPFFIAQDYEGSTEGGGALQLSDIVPSFIGPPGNAYYNAEGCWNDIRSGLLRERIRALFPGFTFTFPDIATFYYGGHATYWVGAMSQVNKEITEDAWLTPLHLVWPQCRLSTYGTYTTTYAEEQALPFWSSLASPGLAKLEDASPELYGVMGSYASLYSGTTIYELFRYDVARFRAFRRSSPLTKYSPWIAYASLTTGFDSNGYSYHFDPRYQRELIYHVLLAGAERILYFNDTGGATLTDDQQTDGAIYELQQMFGNRPRTVAASSLSVINALHTGGDQQVVSGMRDADGVYHWRCSFPASATAVSVAGQNVPVVSGHRGVWYTTLTSTPPTFVVT